MSKWNTMAKSAFIVSALTVFTLIFSFAKEAIFANYYGASQITDAYLIAIQIPVTLFAMVSQAVSNVALPYYSQKLNQDGPEVASRYVSNLMTVITILTIAIVVLLETFPGVVMRFFAPGLGQESREIAIILFRLVLPTIVFTELININTAVQDVHKSFVLPLLGTVILNSVFIASVVFLVSKWGIYAAVGGTIVGTIVEFGYSTFLRRRFLKYRWVCDITDKDMVASVKRSGPVFIGLGIAEINKTVDTMISSFLSAGSVSMMGYATKLTSAITSVLIGGIVKVTYPEYAECASKNDDARMADCLTFAIKIVFLLLVPVVCGGALLSKEIISLVYYRGAFTMDIVVGTAQVFTAYLTCLVFRALRQNFSRVFYAYGDTKTPMVNSLAGLIANTVLDLSLYKTFGMVGIAWATTGTFVVTSVLLAAELKKKNNNIYYRSILPLFLRVAVSNVFMIAVIVCIRKVCVFVGFYDMTSTVHNALFLVISIFSGAIIYFIGLFLLRTTEIVAIMKAILQHKK